MAVIVALDLSESAQAVLARGVALAKQLGQKLHAVHVVDAGIPESLAKATVQGARDLIARHCAACGADAEVEVLRGRARETIAAYALDAGGGVLVVGAHDASQDGLFRFTDSTAGQILRASPLPVLVVKRHGGGEAMPYERAVIGVDFSIYARSAIRHARMLAPEAALHLVHAYQIPFRLRLGTPTYLAEVEARARGELDAFLNEDMKHLIRRAGLEGAAPVKIEGACVQGMPYEALVKEVGRVSADLLVVGTHGAGGMTRALWGSVATALLETPPCDLLVVHET
jgi:nucleotide-binding universal stress UspA family protein